MFLNWPFQKNVKPEFIHAQLNIISQIIEEKVNPKKRQIIQKSYWPRNILDPEDDTLLEKIPLFIEEIDTWILY